MRLDGRFFTKSSEKSLGYLKRCSFSEDLKSGYDMNLDLTLDSASRKE
jgi:hypothetical protein